MSTQSRTIIPVFLCLAGRARDKGAVDTLPSLITNGRSRVDRVAAHLLPIDYLRQAAGPAHRSIATLGGDLCVDARRIQYNQSAWRGQSNRVSLRYHGERRHVATDTGSSGALPTEAVRLMCRLLSQWSNNLPGGNVHGRNRESIEP